MATLLEVDQLSIYFRDQAVVRDLTFSVGQGEVLGLVGESGSGKSLTSLSILRLLDSAARVEGAIRFDGSCACGTVPAPAPFFGLHWFAPAVAPILSIGRRVPARSEPPSPGALVRSSRTLNRAHCKSRLIFAARQFQPPHLKFWR